MLEAAAALGATVTGLVTVYLTNSVTWNSAPGHYRLAYPAAFLLGAVVAVLPTAQDPLLKTIPPLLGFLGGTLVPLYATGLIGGKGVRAIAQLFRHFGA